MHVKVCYRLKYDSVLWNHPQRNMKRTFSGVISKFLTPSKSTVKDDFLDGTKYFVHLI